MADHPSKSRRTHAATECLGSDDETEENRDCGVLKHFKNMLNPKQVISIQSVWSRETCYPKDRQNWSQENPSK
jgi:hypothetical protein